MNTAQTTSPGDQSPPDRGHPVPRRATPEKSITLQNHRLARDASTRVTPGSRVPPSSGSSPRRNSSGDSRETGQSDPKKWFDRSNRNAAATFEPTSMEVDSLFFQKETNSSDEEVPAPFGLLDTGQGPSNSRPTVAHSSSADDFRSVIDDLTIENKRLKEELKRYKQFGTDILSKDKSFEIKIHGLPLHKKRELEATLRDFAASLDGSTDASTHRNKSSKHAGRMHGGSVSNSKHDSSTSSRSRPVDSAYASMSIGLGSAALQSSSSSLARPSAGPSRTSKQKVENYLRDIPEGLYPRHTLMTDADKKKLVVRKLEQLFTGKTPVARKTSALEPVSAQFVMPAPPPFLPAAEPSREAVIQAEGGKKRKARSRDNLSSKSNSNGDGEQTDSRGNGNGSGSGSAGGHSGGNKTSPPMMEPPEQRPTRPRDLDPDRVQVPSENIDYIRHLGLVPPSVPADKQFSSRDVSMDADGWVYLNLLCNLAQLHIFNVTPAFIRSAVSGKSAKFQLSPDGRKIRWRGGTDGTKFSSDSSPDNSHQSSETDESDGSNKPGQRKRQKIRPGHAIAASATSTKNHSHIGPHASSSSGNIYYKPLFPYHPTSNNDTSLDESASQPSFQDVGANPAMQQSRWTTSGSSSSPRKKRRYEGAIVYYSGAPFCTDLCGDRGEISPTTYMTSAGPNVSTQEDDWGRPPVARTSSGSSLPFRPLVERGKKTSIEQEQEPDLITDDGYTSEDVDMDFQWCDNPGRLVVKPLEPRLEPCGLGGVMPDDHFAVLVVTRRPFNVDPSAPSHQDKPDLQRLRSDETAESIANRLASMSTSSPAPAFHTRRPQVEIKYETRRVKEFEPIPLPPPAMFFPPFSSSSESDDDDEEHYDSDEDEDGDNEVAQSEGAISKRVHPHRSDISSPEDSDVVSDDANNDLVSPPEGADPGGAGGAPDYVALSSSKGYRRRPSPRRLLGSLRQQASGGDVARTKSLEDGSHHPGSSAATAGGAESGDDSAKGDQEEK